MEQNEQLTENNETDEEIENGGETETIAEKSAATVEEKPADTAAAGEELPTITDSQATIKIEGQEFELEVVLAQDDKMLKTVLQPHFASIENANITREIKDGKLTVSIVKRAQHKGFETRNAESETNAPFEVLCNEPEEINPAIILAEELMRRDVLASFDFDNFERVEATLAYSRAEIGRIQQHFDALAKTPSAASASVPVGF